MQTDLKILDRKQAELGQARTGLRSNKPGWAVISQRSNRYLEMV